VVVAEFTTDELAVKARFYGLLDRTMPAPGTYHNQEQIGQCQRCISAPAACVSAATKNEM
jgi:hypothetical protein